MTHLRLPKGAESCWELHLGVPVTVARALTSSYVALDVGYRPALPPAFHLSLGPWTLKRAINTISPFQGEGVIYLKL